jgi:pseudouridine kinase
MKKMPKILVVGGMNMDILGSFGSSFTPGDSLPGIIQQCPGGVGRNIAFHLANSGVQVELLCALGNDQAASLLRRSCVAAGISLKFSIETSYPAPTYMAIHASNGDMVCAVNDMRAMESITPDILTNKLNLLKGFQTCVLDANLSESSLSTVAESLSIPLIADPVSAVKCRRLLPVMHRLEAIKPNRLEAEALTGEKDIPSAAKALLGFGVRQVFISLGKEGVYYADRKHSGLLPAIDVPVVRLTGAGDAMIAGLVLGIVNHLPILESAQQGLQASADYLLRTHNFEPEK